MKKKESMQLNLSEMNCNYVCEFFRRQQFAYIEDERHVAEVELVLLLVELLQLGGVVVLALLCHVRSHVGLLLGLEAPNPAHGSATREQPPLLLAA